VNAAAWWSGYIAEPAAFWAGIIFIVTYTLLAPWWRTAIGSLIVSLDAVITLVILPHMLRLYFGIDETSVFYIWFVLTVFSLSPVIILWRTVILVLVHRGRMRLPWRHGSAPPAQDRAHPVDAPADGA